MLRSEAQMHSQKTALSSNYYKSLQNFDRNTWYPYCTGDIDIILQND